MKILRRILKILLALLLVLLIAGFLFVQHLKPDYDGVRPLDGLRDSVSTYFDTYGIPHIYAKSEEDAFRALGYVHAQDRLWQMELLRRIARGGLSEVFGPSLLDTDKFFLTLGIDNATARALSEMKADAPEYLLAQAYMDGINSFIEEGPTPVEYYLTGLDKTPFLIEDIYNALGYMAFSFAMAHKTDPFLEQIKQDWGSDYIHTLLNETPGSTLVIQNHDARDSLPTGYALSGAIRDLLSPLPIPALEGSNSWVLAPGKTESGKVLFANDPHIGFAQPSVWFEAHISTPAYEKYGYHLAGIPFPILAHDRQLAYGFTMFENDDIDFYRERLDPSDTTRYLRVEGTHTFETVERTILVKGEEPVAFRFRKTDIGPVINDAIPALKNSPPVSMAWVYTEGENELLQALYGISHASGLAAFETSVQKIHAPGLNVMYGDAKGNVAWWAAARLHRLPDSLSTKLFLDGATTGPGYGRTLAFSANPKAINPPWGYVYSANNQPDSTEAGFIPGYYLPENRARRITELLGAHDQWNRDSVMQMITDTRSPVNTEIVTALASSVSVQELSEEQLERLDDLNSWDGTYPLDSKEALIYHRWIYYLFEAVFADELGAEGVESLFQTHLFKRLIARLANNPDWIWWDDVNTTYHTEVHSELINRSFIKALESLQQDFGSEVDDWEWGKAHSLEFKHPLGEVALLRSLFNVGPYPVHGSREVINNLSFPYDSTGFYRVGTGPSTRRVIDFSDVESSMSILPTGQSGNPFSPHYEDQTELYLKGQFRKMMLNEREIKENAPNLLEFFPYKAN